MKTVIRISRDHHGDGAYRCFVDEINYLVNEEVNCYCEVADNSFINIVEQEKNYATSEGEFANKTIVDAIGYYQGEWQRYTIHHNLEQDNDALHRLVCELRKSFTHMNSYIVEKFERTEINGKNFDAEPHDYTTFSIRHIEFPDEQDVLVEYTDIYGVDYDECIIEIN